MKASSSTDDEVRPESFHVGQILYSIRIIIIIAATLTAT